MRAFIFAIAVAGCAQIVPEARGPVVTQVSRDVLVCLTRGVMREGDQVTLGRTSCRPVSQKIRVERCTTQPFAVGTVLRVQDERCAVIRVEDGDDPRAGDELQVVFTVERPTATQSAAR
jgi:hypothetical protein